MSAVATSPIDQSFLRRYERDVMLFAKEVLGIEPTVKQAFLFFEVATNRATEFVWRNNEGSTTALAILAVWRFLVYPDANVRLFSNHIDASNFVSTLLNNARKSDLFAEILEALNQKDDRLLFESRFFFGDNKYGRYLNVERMPISPVSLAGQMSEAYFLVDKDVPIGDPHIQVMMGSLTDPESRLAISLWGIA